MFEILNIQTGYVEILMNARLWMYAPAKVLEYS